VGLRVLVPTGNNSSAMGEHRDAYMLDPETSDEPVFPSGSRIPAAFNPRANTEPTFFLGCLMGAALRTRNPLNLELANMVWKPMTGEMPQLHDLEMVDAPLVTSLNSFAAMDAATWEDMDFRWQCLSADGREVPLRAGGTETPVSFADRDLFRQQTIEYRLAECGALPLVLPGSDAALGVVATQRCLILPQSKLAALRRGLEAVVPADYLNLLTPEELRHFVCGSAEIDVDVLRATAIYEGVQATAPHVQFFWRAVESFSQTERRALVRFVTGRSRLPAAADLRRAPMKIAGFNKSGSPDRYFPVSHTCSNCLDLPQYTTYEVCRERFLYAITNCLAIDGDGTPEGGFTE